MKSRDNRPLCKLNRLHWERALKTPCSFPHLINGRGIATRKTFLKDISEFMNIMISQMCFVNCIVGKETNNGMSVRTWAFIANEMKVSEDRVKQCARFAKEREWFTSVQPRKTADGVIIPCASIKTVTDKYFKDLGLEKALKTAKKSAIDILSRLAKNTKVPMAVYLMPITMLHKIAEEIHKGFKGFQASNKMNWFSYFKDKT